MYLFVGWLEKNAKHFLGYAVFIVTKGKLKDEGELDPGADDDILENTRMYKTMQSNSKTLKLKTQGFNLGGPL